MIIKSLLSFYSTPDLNAIAYKPLHYKRSFVITASQTVKHIDQQNIKFSLYSIPLDFLYRVPVFRRNLKTGNTLFVNFLFNTPILTTGHKFPTKLFLHGNIIFFYLPNRRHTIKAIYSFNIFHNYTPFS